MKKMFNETMVTSNSVKMRTYDYDGLPVSQKERLKDLEYGYGVDHETYFKVDNHYYCTNDFYDACFDSFEHYINDGKQADRYIFYVVDGMQTYSITHAIVCDTDLEEYTIYRIRETY